MHRPLPFRIIALPFEKGAGEINPVFSSICTGHRSLPFGSFVKLPLLVRNSHKQHHCNVRKIVGEFHFPGCPFLPVQVLIVFLEWSFSSFLILYGFVVFLRVYLCRIVFCCVVVLLVWMLPRFTVEEGIEKNVKWKSFIFVKWEIKKWELYFDWNLIFFPLKITKRFIWWCCII